MVSVVLKMLHDAPCVPHHTTERDTMKHSKTIDYTACAAFDQWMNEHRIGDAAMGRAVGVDRATVGRWRAAKVPLPGWVWLLREIPNAASYIIAHAIPAPVVRHDVAPKTSSGLFDDDD